ncbi:hypothetical protein OPV22_026557 [Ensete ventricosum]|uniref:Uncharacterized protein n=1 Tax=Ensete ventricosum TaxID=4639 RepID=A0AAV8Q6U8_ENSVE|nr:hypothetical protein OPV22_026557 [Ensete ventricosum]RWW15419.1 hypothetical protein GW17_00020746 [Ensete ventricosum]
MEGAAQVALPVLGIAAAAAVTFYVVSFMELREKSFRELEDSEEKESVGGFRSSASSRQRRARRKAEKEARK